MEKEYSLYHTLNKNISKAKFPKTQEKELRGKLSSLQHNSKKAVVMLIAEHSRVTEQRIFDGETVELPYNGLQDEDDTVFDLKDFPNELKWILWKFVNVGSQ